MSELTPAQKKILADRRAQSDLLQQIEHIAASGQSDDFEGDVGPWMETPISPQAKAAWDRGMKRRKPEEDNRDIFEKALDNAPVIGGAVLGGLGARGILRKIHGGKYATREMKTEANQLAVIGGAPTGALIGAMLSDKRGSKKRRK